jgi:hypothetical protein
MPDVILGAAVAPMAPEEALVDRAQLVRLSGPSRPRSLRSMNAVRRLWSKTQGKLEAAARTCRAAPPIL